MKNYILVFLILAIYVNLVSAQKVDDLIIGPIIGTSFTPNEDEIAINVNFGLYSSNSYFDQDGEKKILKYLLASMADPKITFWDVVITGEYAPAQHFGFRLVMPFIIEQLFEPNVETGYSLDLDLLTGKTGMGDISIGAWYLLLHSSTTRILTQTNFYFATGSSPDEIDETNLGSTGSGHTSIDFGLALDHMIHSRVFVSLGVACTINNETSFSYKGISWDQKNGNEANFNIIFAFKISPKFSLGARLYYGLSGEIEVNGKPIADSDYNYFAVIPTIGYQLHNSFSINLSYQIVALGKNIYSFEGFNLGFNKIID